MTCCSPYTASSTVMGTGGCCYYAALAAAAVHWTGPAAKDNQQSISDRPALREDDLHWVCSTSSVSHTCQHNLQPYMPAQPAAEPDVHTLCLMHCCRESLLCSSSSLEHSGTASPCGQLPAVGSSYPSMGRSKSVGRGLGAEDAQTAGYCYGEKIMQWHCRHHHTCRLQHFERLNEQRHCSMSTAAVAKGGMLTAGCVTAAPLFAGADGALYPAIDAGSQVRVATAGTGPHTPRQGNSCCRLEAQLYVLAQPHVLQVASCTSCTSLSAAVEYAPFSVRPLNSAQLTCRTFCSLAGPAAIDAADGVAAACGSAAGDRRQGPSQGLTSRGCSTAGADAADVCTDDGQHVTR